MKNGEQKDLGCNGKGKRIILVKVKKFREPAKMFIQCGGCAKCQSHLTKRVPDVCDSCGATWIPSMSSCSVCGTGR